MEPWKDEVDELGDKIVGKTLVTLDQTMCRHSECLLGDFVADAMVYSVSVKSLQLHGLEIAILVR
jgi:hypothetical protein